MSAIFGILGYSEPIDSTLIATAKELLRHCGEYNKSISFMMKWRDKECNNSILASYSEIHASNQPLYNDKQDIIISFDGEIYNADELRAQLADKGISFSGNTDCELLLKLYERFGLMRMLDLLDGVWGLFLLDKTSNKAYIVRDKMGEKPIYYCNQKNAFLFSSEIKAFYAYPSFCPELNEDAVSEYFVFRYPCGNSTFLKDVNLVSPGCFLEISNGEINEHIYWTLPASKSNNLTKEENKQKLDELIEKSIRNRLFDKQHIGAQLSGGIDSSYVCAKMKDMLSQTFNTYSITFEGSKDDESKYVDYVNGSLNLKSIRFDCRPCDFLSNWEKATWYYESPINHEGTVPLLQLNSLASQENTYSILCGDGADESLGGYPIFRRIDCFKRDLWGLRWYGVKAKAILNGKSHYYSLDEHFISLHQFIEDSQLQKLRPHQCKHDIKIAYGKRLDILHKFEKNDFLHKYTNYDLCTYGHDCMLRTKKMAMASGITIRSPFLMPELQEFIQTIPSQYLTDYRKPYMHSTKILLKELCVDVYGAEFTYRPKIGLGVPLLKVFKDSEVRSYIENQILPSVQKRGIVNYEFVRDIWQDTLSHPEDDYYSELQVLWCVFSFEIWAKMYLGSLTSVRKHMPKYYNEG